MSSCEQTNLEISSPKFRLRLGRNAALGHQGDILEWWRLLPAAWGLRTLFSLWQKDGHKQDSAVTNTTGRWCISANGTFCCYREAAPASSCPAENLAASRRCNRDPRTFGRCTTQEGCFQFDLPSISYKEPIVSTTLHHKPSTHQEWAWGRQNNPCQVTRGDHIVACDVLLQRYNNRELA